MNKVSSPQNPLGERSFYYPSLDGLRFFGFLLVFLHHIFQTTRPQNPIQDFFITIFKTNGWVGVDLFLILSGFLVTTLLLKEKLHHDKFSIKDFQIRRILRIWPLYYLSLFLGFFLFPLILGQFNSPQTLLKILYELPLYVLFLGNWSVVFGDYSQFRYIGLLWTISLEQQFYFFWPVVLLVINKFKTAVLISLTLITAAILSRWILFQFNVQHPDIYVNTLTRIDTLIYGALLAFVNFYHPDWKRYLKPVLSLPLQIVFIVVFFVLLYYFGSVSPYSLRHSIYGYLLTGFFSTYFIVSSLNTNSLYSKLLTKKPLVFLGKLSYGLYVFHILGIDLSKFLIGSTGLRFLEPILALGITIFISWISYQFFEVRFLKLKNKFTKISSRPL